jgi:hypothetical protein
LGIKQLKIIIYFYLYRSRVTPKKKSILPLNVNFLKIKGSSLFTMRFSKNKTERIQELIVGQPTLGR